MLMIVDISVDWMKHFFLVKLNQHPHHIIQQYSHQVANFIYAVYHCNSIKKVEEVKLFSNHLNDDHIHILSHKLPD